MTDVGVISWPAARSALDEEAATAATSNQG